MLFWGLLLYACLLIYLFSGLSGLVQCVTSDVTPHRVLLPWACTQFPWLPRMVVVLGRLSDSFPGFPFKLWPISLYLHQTQLLAFTLIAIVFNSALGLHNLIPLKLDFFAGAGCRQSLRLILAPRGLLSSVPYPDSVKLLAGLLLLLVSWNYQLSSNCLPPRSF